jgi:formin-1
MEELGNSLNGNHVLQPEKPEAELEMAQSILSKFSMKSLFGFTSKLESVKPKEEDAVLKAFHSLEVDPTPQENHPDPGADLQEADAQVPADLRNDGKAARSEAGSEESREPAAAESPFPGQELLPLAALDVGRDDVIWVHGTLVHTTSDSDSDDGGQEPEEGSSTSGSKSPGIGVLEPSQEPKENSEESKENSAIEEGCEAQLCAEDAQKTPPEISNNLELGNCGLETQHNPSEGQAGEGCQVPPPVTDHNLSAGVTESYSSRRETPGEKSFQLPAFFSGLRVLKKGVAAEGGETITEIKPKDGDLALLKLTQPVQKSLGHAGPQTVKSRERAADLKATPTLLEQLSQLLNIDMPKTEPKATDPDLSRGEEMGCSTEQESQSGSGDAQIQSGEVKPKPPETALEAFKALFIRPPKKGTTADTSELEALKRKMRQEKESLRAVFERSKSRPVDGPSDSKSVCRVRFCPLL